ncbi:hypothetical protein SAMN05444156_3264 [Verrucomicrobium sp. GAS474]|uniref:hypothetical protein n=1 Tax=Verrucomicrobium sp. GAS474 TaxID=1882831 RepID=UPI00087AC3BE|nr:hypothetical protein [Verrucomicrobium sp. GAS474]SDU30911.1 hypothetical protein SAMN05444156_3210 [Verrucomicrobium sp. GAS474]SDU31796.1 hypothetical protein SAMN05444156_3264 [Verrucomicrobium sp. GAS474]
MVIPAWLTALLPEALKAWAETAGLIKQRDTESNTPAMIQNAQTLREAAEVEKDNEAEAKAIKGDESDAQSRLS